MNPRKIVGIPDASSRIPVGFAVTSSIVHGRSIRTCMIVRRYTYNRVRKHAHMRVELCVYCAHCTELNSFFSHPRKVPRFYAHGRFTVSRRVKKNIARKMVHTDNTCFENTLYLELRVRRIFARRKEKLSRILLFTGDVIPYRRKMQKKGRREERRRLKRLLIQDEPIADPTKVPEWNCNRNNFCVARGSKLFRWRRQRRWLRHYRK